MNGSAPQAWALTATPECESAYTILSRRLPGIYRYKILPNLNPKLSAPGKFGSPRSKAPRRLPGSQQAPSSLGRFQQATQLSAGFNQALGRVPADSQQAKARQVCSSVCFHKQLKLTTSLAFLVRCALGSPRRLSASQGSPAGSPAGTLNPEPFGPAEGTP